MANGAFKYNNISYKGPYPDEQMYVNYSKMFTKRRFLNLLVTAREMGKSYGSKIEVVLRSWYEDGYKTLWLRRFGTQVDKELEGDFWGSAPQTFFEKYGERYGLEQAPEITSDGSHFYCDGEEFMEIMALTEAVNAKGQEHIGTANIVLDEFIEKELYKYIAPAMSEPSDYLLKMAKTFFRDANIPPEDRHIYLLANAESITNPYFIEFDMVDAVREDTEWLMNENILLWMPRMSELLYEKLMKDPLNQIIMGTSYAAVALNNTFFNGGSLNIKPKLLPKSKLLFSLQIYGAQFFIYNQEESKGNEYLYVYSKGSFNGERYVLDSNSFKHEDERVIPRSALENFRAALSMNMVKYDSIKTKALITENIKGRNR